MAEPPFAHLALPGATFEVAARPGARRNLLSLTEDGLKAEVTVAPEGGRANAAITRLLAKGLGVAPSRLVLLRGAKARTKVFRLSD